DKIRSSEYCVSSRANFCQFGEITEVPAISQSNSRTSQDRCRLATCLGVDYLQAMAKRYQNRIELLQGTLDMLILQTLRWGPQHGYGIAAAIRAGSQEVLQVETGSLYPALHRMEKQGWVKSEWKQTENNQRAKFYNLTAAGRKHLAAEQSRWNQMTGAIAGLMNRGEA